MDIGCKTTIVSHQVFFHPITISGPFDRLPAGRVLDARGEDVPAHRHSRILRGRHRRRVLRHQREAVQGD